MPIRRANSACDSPARLRTRRTQAAASSAASASSKAAWRSISALVVASTRAQSVRGATGSQRPVERRRGRRPSHRGVLQSAPYRSLLPGVCLAGGDDPRHCLTPRVGDHEQPSGDAAVEPETFFAIVSPNVPHDPSVRIEERRQAIGKTDPRSRTQRSLFASSHSNRIWGASANSPACLSPELSCLERQR